MSKVRHRTAHFDPEKAIARGSAREAVFEGVRYARFADDSKEVLRGTVAFGGHAVCGYPHIGRLLTLQPGLRDQFRAPFWMEEKVDGYNVRICRVDGRAIALTRGGYVCPFTTDRLPDLLDLSILDAEPDLVICAEVAGPENPYIETSPRFVTEDVRLFVFDLMRIDRPGFLPQPQTYDHIDRWALPAVTRFGRFSPDDLDAIQDIVRRLNGEHREGVVFKEDSPRERRAKYITSNAGIADIRSTAASLLEFPPEYYTNRILHLVLFLYEQAEERSTALQQRLGAAFLDGLLDAIHQYEKERKVYRTFRCRFHDRGNAVALMTHLEKAGGHKVQVSRRDLRREDGYWVLEFDRSYPAVNGLLSHLLKGGLLFD